MIWSEIFSMLARQWSFKRDVTGYGMGHGHASFVKISDSMLEYKETGKIKLFADGRVVNFCRSYRYLFCDKIEVYFNDGASLGRLFQTLKLKDESNVSLSFEGYHLCEKDVYSSEYVFLLPDGFKIVHNVLGPKKQYTSVTWYNKRCA